MAFQLQTRNCELSAEDKIYLENKLSNTYQLLNKFSQNFDIRCLIDGKNAGHHKKAEDLITVEISISLPKTEMIFVSRDGLTIRKAFDSAIKQANRDVLKEKKYHQIKNRKESSSFKDMVRKFFSS